MAILEKMGARLIVKEFDRKSLENSDDMHGLARMPLTSEIPWDKIKEVRVSKDGQNFSFEFDIVGKRQKMTIAIKPDSTSYTLSKEDGSPIVHADQRGTEISVVDFDTTPSKLPGWVKKMQKKGRKN